MPVIKKGEGDDRGGSQCKSHGGRNTDQQNSLGGGTPINLTNRKDPEQTKERGGRGKEKETKARRTITQRKERLRGDKSGRT